MAARGGSRDRIEAAERRLQRLRELIERRARAGDDTGDAWRLFSLTVAALQNMREGERRRAALDHTGRQEWGDVQAALLDARRGDPISVKAGAVIRPPASADCYLVESGLASLRFGHAKGVEVGMVGSGGIIGLQALLTAEVLPLAAVATVPCRAAVLPVKTLVDQLAAVDHGLKFLHAVVALQWAESAVLARCNAQHSVGQRLARWTLTAYRRVNGPIGPIGHARIAAQLGVRRASVSVAIQELEDEGAIRSTRNFIEVRDEAELERLTCECAALIASRNTMTMGTPQPQQPSP